MGFMSMGLKTLLPAGIGDENSLKLNGGKATFWQSASDGDDSTYGYWDAGLATTSLCTLEAHGLAVGTTINSVTQYYRGYLSTGFDTGYWTGRYKIAGGTATNCTVRNNTTIATFSETIPAPSGGWDLTKLANLQIGGACRVTPTVTKRSAVVDVWVVVDYTAPAAGGVLTRKTLYQHAGKRNIMRGL